MRRDGVDRKRLALLSRQRRLREDTAQRRPAVRDCEKKLVRDVIMCVDKSTLATSVNLNASTSISISSFDQTNYFKASLCIEYCRGTGSNQVRMTVCFAFLQHLKRVHYFNGNVILFLVCGYRWIDMLLRRQTPHGPKRTRYNR